MSNAHTSRISIADLATKKKAGQKWAMLTCYEQITAEIFDQAGIPVLLVGDSAGNNFLGFENTIPVTVDELIPLARAVVTASQKAMVVADFPFGSYESSPDQALATGVRFFKEAKVGAVKLEGGVKVVPQIEKLIAAGIPVMGHLGLTPQSVHALGGFKVQGRDEAAAAQMIEDAAALEAAGADMLLLECVPSHLGKTIAERATVPVIGIGAGPDTDGQILVIYDILGLSPGKKPRFVKNFLDGGDSLEAATTNYVAAVKDSTYPGPEHGFK